MQNLIVLGFDTEEEANQVLESLKQGRKDGLVDIDDAAVITKDADGKVHVKNQVSKGTWTATGVGGLLGLLVGFIFFPVGALIMGLAGGALVGRMMNLGVDGKFVKDVQEQLKPGTSALFVLTGKTNASGEIAIMRQHKGTVLQTTLSTEDEEALKKAMGDDTPIN